MSSPKEVQWHFGKVPAVEDEPEAKVILLSKDYAGYASPWGNKLNPVKWCDSSCHPRWGFERPTGWWLYWDEYQKMFA